MFVEQLSACLISNYILIKKLKRLLKYVPLPMYLPVTSNSQQSYCTKYMYFYIIRRKINSNQLKKM